MEEHVMVCENSMEGIFTGIYEAYRMKLPHRDTCMELGEGEPRLFAVYHEVQTEPEKAEKVMRTLRELLGEERYYDLIIALYSEDPERGQAVYQTVVQLMEAKADKTHKGGNEGLGRVLDNLSNPNIHKVFTLSRNVTNEIHRQKEFLRFKELESGIMYSRIGPKSNVVELLMPHFSNRFPLENFIIYDENRNLFGIHPAKQEWFMAKDLEFQEEMLVLSGKETGYQELFRYFCHKIAIKERENLNLQRNMLPLRFRDYMTEFK